MPWGAAIAAVGAIGGGLLAADASKKAAKTQQQAAGQATGVQKDIFAATNLQQQPFIGASYGALKELTRLLGTPEPIYGGDKKVPPITGPQPIPGSGSQFGPGGRPERFENAPGTVSLDPQEFLGGSKTNPRAPGRARLHAASAQSMGRAGDDYLVHVNADELGQMHDMWGEASVNPNTGLREYGFFSKVKQRVKNAFDPKNALSTKGITNQIFNPGGAAGKIITGKDIGPGTMMADKVFGDDEKKAVPEAGGTVGIDPREFGINTPTGYTPSNTGLEDGYLTQTFGPEQFRAGMDPGYQWRFQQGMQGVMNSTAPTYGALSGPALKALISYGQGEASTEFGSAFDRYQTQQGNIFQRLSSLVNLGQNAAAGVGQQGTAVGGNIGGNIVGAGNAGAAGRIGQANAWSNALGQLGSIGYLQANQGG